MWQALCLVVIGAGRSPSDGSRKKNKKILVNARRKKKYTILYRIYICYIPLVFLFVCVHTTLSTENCMSSKSVCNPPCALHGQLSFRFYKMSYYRLTVHNYTQPHTCHVTPLRTRGHRVAGCGEVQLLDRRQVGCARRRRMGRVRVTGAQIAGRMWRASLSGFAADVSSMEAGMGRLLD